MNRELNLDAMSIDELWRLHEEISRVLSVRLTAEKRELEERLARLRGEQRANQIIEEVPRERRKYPPVCPKYQNSSEPYETWSGRGKQPRWLAAALKTGHTIDEFVISNQEPGSGSLRQQAWMAGQPDPSRRGSIQ